MLSFAQAPKTAYRSLDDVGKFNMIWDISLILIPAFIVLATMHIAYRDDNWSTSLIGEVLAITNVVVLKKTRKYKTVGIYTVALSVLVVQASVFLVNDSHLITDTMWCLLSGFFTFFILGARWGTFVLLLNLTGLTLFLLFTSANDVLNKGISPSQVNDNMVLNVFFVGVALAYIIYKMVDNNKQINKRYEKQIEQNEVLMKEIHHRVKNNLQIISSLLRLQAAESKSPQVKVQFDEAISRIRSMALIHEKMYQKEDLTRIDVREYLVSLTDELVKSIQTRTTIEFIVSSELDEMDVKSIVPVSLIFNELITNSIKHGFANAKEGKIKVDIKRTNRGVDFEYYDNGQWLEPKEEGTFGLDLLNTLTEQLDGTFRREINNGTLYVFSFPLENI